MIGNGTDLSKYLVNFNSADWANQANAHLQQAINQALPYGEKYTQQAINAVQDYSNQAQKDIGQSYQSAQALNTPQHLATYNALDAYTNSLGLASPQGGSYNLAQNLNAEVNGNQPNQAVMAQDQSSPGLLSQQPMPAYNQALTGAQNNALINQWQAQNQQIINQPGYQMPPPMTGGQGHAGLFNMGAA